MKAGRQGNPIVPSTGSEVHRVEIAWVAFDIAIPKGMRLQNLNLLYRSFSGRSRPSEHSGLVPVRLAAGRFPSLAGLKRVYDTKESWHMLEGGSNLWIVFHPPQRSEPLWVARFDRPVRRATVFCKAVPPKTPRGKSVLNQPIVYPLDQLLLMHYFARRHGMLAHAAGLVYKGQAHLFAGVSGAGKSTFSELLVKSKTGKVLSDERMIVREIKGEMVAFGTPWAGTAQIARNGSAPLAGIFFLKHGKVNRIERMDAVAAADRMLPMISIPWYDPDAAAAIIAFARRLLARVPAYEMNFTPDRSAIDFLLKFIEPK